jgi:hypothetical protein
MTNQIPIRGNICSCGQVWFCYDLPESDPSRCPFCSRQIDAGEIYDDEDVQEQVQEGVLPDEISSNIGKATGETPVHLVPKVCGFCVNELFFDEVDAPNAQHCPYCDDKLMDADQFMQLAGVEKMPEDNQTQEFVDELTEILGGNMGELVDERVSVKFRTWNPFAKEKTCIFKGLDLTNMHVKLQVEEDNSLIWISLNEIKQITVISDQSNPK